MLLTHAYVHLLADVHLVGFAPAFTLSLSDSEAPANRRMPIASVVSCKLKKNKTMTESTDSLPIKEIITVASPFIKAIVDSFVTPKLENLKKRFSQDYSDLKVNFCHS